MLYVLTGWEVLVELVLAGSGEVKSRLRRVRGWVFPTLSGERDWDLGDRDSDVVLLCLPLCILAPRLLSRV